MGIGVYFSISSLIIISILSCIFFLKKRVINIETKIYGKLLILTLIGLFLEIFTCFWYNIFGEASLDNFLYQLVSKMTSAYYMLWSGLFVTYIISICNTNEKMKKAFNTINVILFCLILLLPISFNVSETEVLPTGISIALTYVICFTYGIIDLFFCLKYRKKIVSLKFTPVYSLLFLGTLDMFLGIFFPSLFLMGYVYSLIVIIMYHTIENPDVRMIQQLEVAKDAADKANHAKTDFLSSMSHEIRTPLNAIVGFSDCIMDAESLEEAKENAKDIVNASQTLLEIVNGILDISKIEAGKLEIVNSRYDASETFHELAKLITPKMNEKGLDFTYSIAPDLPKTLFGDHANLKKVVTNLLSNACKYTKVGFVHYEVNCVNTGDICKLIISVEDSGQGIKKENVSKLFTKFQRLEEDKNTTIEGTGLGLAITKQLIELMGGQIIVHTVYGEGSKFTVILNQKIENEPVKDTKRVKTTLNLKGVRILMVDDTLLNLKVASKLLEKYGANQVVTCDSGFECLDRIQRGEKYDVILLDDMMPKMSGVITLKKLKEIPTFHIPTIALTANAITGMREKYLADGFTDYLAKPIEKEQLVQVMNQVLGRSITEEISLPKEELDKKEIPPVEEEKQEETKEEKTEVSTVDLVPVVDIHLPDETSSEEIVKKEEKVDRTYLEENGVDVDHALELLGDMDMYNMTISDFLKEVEEKWNRIIKYKDECKMADYAIEVHSLKSDSKYLGFMKLADISYQHELKSKENDIDFVLSHFAELEEEYYKILEIARKYVEHNPVEDS